MQLFTIGLYELNQNGTLRRTSNGDPIETYTNADVSALAKVFTGLSWAGPDTSEQRFRALANDGAPAAIDREITPMQAYNQFHSSAEKTFLGTTIPATPDGKTPNTKAEVKIALDRLFNHPNTAPFFAKQMIQRLVSANPTPEYVGRVAAAFNNSGQGVRGDMPAVIRAILLDPEARDTTRITATSGKIREPFIAQTQMYRAFDATSQFGLFRVFYSLEAPTGIQMPLRAPSVFNFYRPEYVPPNSQTGDQGLVSPESQIFTEESLVLHLSSMNNLILSNGGFTKLNFKTNEEVALASNATQLVSFLNTLLAGGSLSPATLTKIIAIVEAIPITADQSDADKKSRVMRAAYLISITPEFFWQH
jgi:uncharacterized protein (DUF1800 family)